jgi:carboxyl-terminal processing protease
MMKKNGTPSRRIAWSAVAAVMLILSAVSVSVPGAFAQQADPQAQQMKHYFQVLESVYQFVAQNYVDPADVKKLYEGAMKGMLEALGDPYSVYLDDATWKYLNDNTLVGKFGGIGVSIAKQTIPASAPADTPSYVEVFSVFDGTPGAKAGIKPGDLIVKIEGETTAPLTIDDVQSRIRGDPGTKVNLTLRRGQAEFDITVIRAVIEIPTVKSGLIPTPKGNIAYLRIIEFSPSTFGRVNDAIKSFNAAGYRAMVLDLRSNPGGLLESATNIANLFLDTGVIVSTKGRNPYENMTYTAKPSIAVPKDKPVVVLINKGSASAAEILAGALKDSKRAYLVGENSYGKGSVQQIVPVEDTGFKLTMARYYTPSDENIDKTGIPPDLVSKEPDLDEAATLALQKIADTAAIETWAKGHSNATVAERNAFAKQLNAAYPAISETLLRMLVRDELARTDNPPAYDLEFDTVLKDAMAVIDSPDYAARLAATKTVKELVEAKKAAALSSAAGAALPAASTTTSPGTQTTPAPTPSPTTPGAPGTAPTDPNAPKN